MSIVTGRPKNILLIDDDADVLESYQHLLKIAGHTPHATLDPTEAVTSLTPQWQGIVISDIYMPSMNGLEVLEHVQEIDPQIPVILITGHGDIPLAVESVKKGAFDFIEKPVSPPDFLALVNKAMEARKAVLSQRAETISAVEEALLGESSKIRELRQQLSSLAESDKDVLVEGDMGSGRHTIAQLLHKTSKRSDGPYIVFDCYDNTTTDELKTIADNAEGGTLVLRHVEMLSPENQRWLSQKLLDNERYNVKAFRAITLFDQNSQQHVDNGTLSPELFYFLSQVRIALPSLNARKDDIVPMFRAFLKNSCKRLGRPLPTVEKAYLNTLKNHDWPGNVRELKNVAELYAIGIVKLTNADRTRASDTLKEPLDDLIEGYEKKLIEDALYLCSGRINDAATYLHIPRKKLYLRMKKHGLDKDQFKPG
ncbi:sigma-54-dependent transcriptional regulator [Grimontia hollisae]|uniref:sigma-54-dependent transcriptional regulator n=1 Tax=Grimontia hollisae TaxID=673 RepID=UPI0012AD008B|nr:sigma-54 dependent transcriptional regulator [Grimontia hollisae]